MIPVQVLAFLRKHWRPIAVLALLAAVFFAGRASAPDQPARVVTETRTVYQDRIVEVERKVEVKVRDEAATATRVVYRDRYVEPSGAVHEHTEERTEAKSEAHEKATATAQLSASRETTQRTEQRVIAESRPSWRVTALAGVDLRDTRPLALQPGTLTAGVSVEHRLAGGLSAGLWALHRFDGAAPLPVVGLSLSYEF